MTDIVAIRRRTLTSFVGETHVGKLWMEKNFIMSNVGCVHCVLNEYAEEIIKLMENDDIDVEVK